MQNRKSAVRIKAKKPPHVLLRPVKVDYTKLFKAVGSGAKNIGTVQWDKLTSDAVDSAAALGLVEGPDQIAFTLLHRALAKALLSLIGESNLRNLASELGLKKRDFLIENLTGEKEFELTKSFFERPAETAILSEVQEKLRDWLNQFGLPTASIESIVSRLPSHFQSALTEEWRQNASKYRPILEVLKSPFLKADDRELGWRLYNSYLEQRVDEGVFDAPFSLSQIYIPLCGYYIEHERAAGKRNFEPHAIAGHNSSRRVVITVEEELLSWLESSNKDELLRVVSGGPGSGKSSFAKMFAASVAKEGKMRVLFIELHEIDAKKDLVDEISRCIQDEGILASNPLSNDDPESRILVILDGLDELATQGRAAAETARAFIGEVQRTLNRKNKHEIRLRILLSGRELIIQENESEFRRPREIITLLPYYVQQDERSQYHDPKKLLERDLRQDWWKNYGLLTGNPKLAGLPASLRKGSLSDVTSQPLLNYLVALSYTRAKINFDESVNLNEVYADLVEAVHEGSHNRRKHTAIKGMSLEDFQRVLEEVALAAWHGDGRSTTVREIEEHCQASNLAGLLKRFQEGAESGVTRLLAAFFFRRHGQRVSGDATFIFTHKSFGEYLTGCRLVRAVERISKQTALRQSTLEDGWTERQALSHWAGLCGPASCTSYIKDFIVGELARRNTPDVNSMRISLAHLFTHLIEFGMPMERVEIFKDGKPSVGLSTFPDALYQSRNAEEALLVALNAASVVTKTTSFINLPKGNPSAFGSWLRRIQEQRSGPKSCLAQHSLSYLGIPGASLDIADFYDADLRCADLSKLSAQVTCFMRSNLTDANLSGSMLMSSDFTNANLSGANLEGAVVEDCNFSGTITDHIKASPEVLAYILKIKTRKSKESEENMKERSLRQSEAKKNQPAEEEQVSRPKA